MIYRTDMKTKYPLTLITLWIFVLITAFAYLRGIPTVPFHPDESTRIFTSGDIDLLFQRPASLFWREEASDDSRQTYRELDAPLANYIIAIGRWLGGNPPLAQDWDWSKTWQENERAGALPSQELLLASRMVIASLFPLSLIFFFFTAHRFANLFTAWISVFLFATNALVILHTRRAMAEGLLVFTTILSLWCLVCLEQKRWLVAVPAALSFCAKQSLAPLIPLGLLASLWPVEAFSQKRLQHALIQCVKYIFVVLIILFLLHPFLWKKPVKAISAAIQARQDLAARQIADRPGQALNTHARRLVSLVGNLYFTPPMLSETGNYFAETRAAELAYLGNPLHSLFRSIPAGAVLFTLTLFGFSTGILRSFKENRAAQRRLILILAATVFQVAVIYWLIPLPWQRYYLPLIPYACLWAAFGIDQVRQMLSRGILKQSCDKRGGFYTPGRRP